MFKSLDQILQKLPESSRQKVITDGDRLAAVRDARLRYASTVAAAKKRTKA